MVLIRHELSDEGRKYLGRGSVTFYRCTATRTSTVVNLYIDDRQCTQPRYDNNGQCLYMRPNKYQKRMKGERHK